MKNQLLRPIVTLISTLALSNLAYAATPAYYSKAAENKAIEFAPGIISTKDHFEINTVFNKAGNSVLFARCTDDFKACTMMESKYKNGSWQAAQKLHFSGGYLEADPYYTPDESYIYFVSKRPIDDSGKEAKSVNLWRSKKVGDSWQTPEYLPKLSSNADDLYPSFTKNGDLYFPSFRNNQRLFYVAKATDNGFEEPRAMPSAMFGEGGKIGDSVALADGKAIIFSMRRDDSVGKGDLYISHLIDGKWTVAKSLGDKVNTSDHEFTPIVSPDGKYLFFTRVENGRGNLYQIALSALL
jgi:hypothetical protein